MCLLLLFSLSLSLSGSLPSSPLSGGEHTRKGLLDGWWSKAQNGRKITVFKKLPLNFLSVLSLLLSHVT